MVILIMCPSRNQYTSSLHLPQHLQPLLQYPRREFAQHQPRRPLRQPSRVGRRTPSQNLPLLFFHSPFSGIASTVSQCSTIFPPSKRKISNPIFGPKKL